MQEQTASYTRDLRQVQGKITSCQRDIRSNQVTRQHITNYDENTNLYRAVGKAFVYSSHNNVQNKLAEEYESLQKTLKDLTDRKEYLERRIVSNKTNMNDIMIAAGGSSS